MKSDRGSRFEKFTNAKLLGSHCTPDKSCRNLSGGHFGTRIFVLAQCLRCLMTVRSWKNGAWLLVIIRVVEFQLFCYCVQYKLLVHKINGIRKTAIQFTKDAQNDPHSLAELTDTSSSHFRIVEIQPRLESLITMRHFSNF